ncbi:hypothetical protein EW146_g6002 [Bondarzewia mesenterica]|uniref:Uncharacterized protein n=1 Tax=Bondarzewia mesenterica TaxID=1095465 RepID=A0A4S4LQF3_9AGAM|nr:hypothetical protein EW146_g6002 [Bondarzewia mesenterica]
MATAIPPSLSQEHISTSAAEWADQTSSALGADTTHAQPAAHSGVKSTVESSTATTPGAELPGAYPRDPNAGSTNQDTAAISKSAGNVAQNTKEVSQDVVGDASKDVQNAGQTAAQHLPTNVVNTTSPYLPGGGVVIASAHDHPHRRSLPSEEMEGMLPGEKSEGVGALPGNVDESGVARLPDESAVADEEIDLPEATNAAGPATAGKPAAAASGEKGVKTASGTQAVKGSSTLPVGAPMPTQEHTGTQASEKVGDVGALPGKQSETGANPGKTAATENPSTTKTEEVKHEVQGASETVAGTDSGPTGANSDRGQHDVGTDVEAGTGVVEAGAGVVEAGAGEAGAGPASAGAGAAAPKVRHDAPHIKLQPRQWRTWQGIGGGITPADKRMADNDVDGGDDSVEAHVAENDIQRHTADDNRVRYANEERPQETPAAKEHEEQSSVGSKSAAHRPNFMDKLRGEVKIISGTLGSDQAKVEEGKRMKRGEV